MAVEGLLLADTPTSMMANKEKALANAQFDKVLDIQDRLRMEATKGGKGVAVEAMIGMRPAPTERASSVDRKAEATIFNARRYTCISTEYRYLGARPHPPAEFLTLRRAQSRRLVTVFRFHRRISLRARAAAVFPG